VFVLICGSIVVAGVRLLGSGDASGALSERDALVAGPTLVLSSALPTVVEKALGAEWLAAQPTALALLFSNSVVLAVLLGVALQAVVGERRA
jgi:hypothetical protein